MKKVLVVLAVVALAVAFFGTTACKKAALADPTPTATQFVLVDDFINGNNRTNTDHFGGYWYTFDDAAAEISSSTSCGDSTVWPISDSVARQTPNCTPTFIMSSYTVAGETPPTGVTSPYFARVHGSVDKSGTGYVYGFVGFGCNLLDVAGDGFKNTINATALGYKRLRFWYKNGPTVSTTPVPWKVKLPNSALVGGGPCVMGEVDDVPVCKFTTSNTWQLFDKSLTADFANEGWPASGGTTCGGYRNATMTACAIAVGGVSFYDGGNQYKNTPAEALAALNALQWQTDFPNTAGPSYPYDIEIAQVEITK